jgi:hypothetical protein
MGMMRTSPPRAFQASPQPTHKTSIHKTTFYPIAEIPASHKFLRLPFSAGSREFAEIFGTIDIPRDPRQLENNTRQAGGFCGGQMRQETIVPKAQREQISRRPPGCIRSAPRRIRCKHSATRRSAIDNLLQFSDVDQRNIRRNHQRAVLSSLAANRGCHLDGVRLSRVIVVNNLKIETLRQLARIGSLVTTATAGRPCQSARVCNTSSHMVCASANRSSGLKIEDKRCLASARFFTGTRIMPARLLLQPEPTGAASPLPARFLLTPLCLQACA